MSSKNADVPRDDPEEDVLEYINESDGEPNRVSAVGRRATTILSGDLISELDVRWEEIGTLVFDIETGSGRMHHHFTKDDDFKLAKSMLSSVDFTDLDVDSVLIEFTVVNPVDQIDTDGESEIDLRSNEHLSLTALACYYYKVTKPGDGNSDSGSSDNSDSDSPEGIRPRDIVRVVDVDLSVDVLSSALLELSNRGMIDVKTKIEEDLKVNYYRMNWAGWRELWILGHPGDSVESFDLSEAMADVERVATSDLPEEPADPPESSSGGDGERRTGPNEKLRGNSAIGSSTAEKENPSGMYENPNVDEAQPVNPDTRDHEALSMLYLAHKADDNFDGWYTWTDIREHDSVVHTEEGVSYQSLNTSLSNVFRNRALIKRRKRDGSNAAEHQINQYGIDFIEENGIADKTEIRINE